MTQPTFQIHVRVLPGISATPAEIMSVFGCSPGHAKQLREEGITIELTADNFNQMVSRFGAQNLTIEAVNRTNLLRFGVADVWGGMR